MCCCSRIHIRQSLRSKKHCIRLATTCSTDIYFLYYYFHVILVYFHFKLAVAVIQWNGDTFFCFRFGLICGLLLIVICQQWISFEIIYFQPETARKRTDLITDR